MQQEEIIQKLSQKINILIALYEKCKLENTRLETENKNLSEIVKNKQKEIVKFEEKINTLKTAKLILGTEDKHEAKLRVNRIVREIDKCIALLNK